MNDLLIVDDEIFTVEIIKAQFQWDELGIDNVYTAYSVNQAIRILRQVEIGVLICDVEMGDHSGLELLAWVRDHCPRVVSFILSGHAQFEYCQRAIQLGSINYVLKPIEYDRLREVIVAAVQKAKEQQRELGLQRQLDASHNQKLAAQFWNDVINKTIAPERSVILREAEKIGVPIMPEDRFLVILMNWGPKEGADKDTGMMDPRSALNSIAEKQMEGFVIALSAIINKYNYYIIRQNGDDPEAQMIKLTRNCQQMGEHTRDYLQMELFFCIGEFQPPESLYEQFRRVFHLFQDQGRRGSGIITLENGRKVVMYDKPDLQAMMLLLEAGRWRDLTAMVKSYLEKCDQRKSLNYENLRRFQKDFYHMVYTVADKRLLDRAGIQGGEKEWVLSDLEGVYASIEAVVSYMAACMEDDGRQKPALERAKEYIDARILDGELSRDAVAKELGVSPEHLSKIFRKQEGVSFLEYIQAKKVSAACDLLRDTRLPVSQVASTLGYSNFAYFAQVFKRITGQNPMAYRKNNAK